ncbi:SMP-30/gluconolactonase/LRE family protein [Sphingomonas sp. MMS24-J13]|uniref:SMP-30/gluconolactonase/LRE family protein n=1 Tax=Sphingomonas sp. MMS24-J13 TaxID=3238686 RepID=UPI00384C4551
MGGHVLAEVTSGLRFPEGPVVMPDGQIIVVEINAGRVTRIDPRTGAKTVIAANLGGPNGLALGPDGMLYLCNNGGFDWIEGDGVLMPFESAPDYVGGSIQRVDPATGAVETLYTHAGDVQLRGPNDIVFDAHGGFWFTDFGKIRRRDEDITGIFYAKADGSFIEEVIHPMRGPNGIGLSPDGKTLYVAETFTCTLHAFEVMAPGKVADGGSPSFPGRFLHRPAGSKYFDSLAVEAGGNICVGTLGVGGISVISPEGEAVEFVETGDPVTTNIAFGGEDMMTAYITCSSSGRLLSTRWQRPGLRLAFP